MEPAPLAPARSEIKSGSAAFSLVALQAGNVMDMKTVLPYGKGTCFDAFITP